MQMRGVGEQVDRFEIVRVLGAGGMGVVYAANDPQLDRTIALKLVKPGTADTGERLVDEARAMARLSHPNVVSVFDAGAHEQDVWVAMECITGGTLARWMRAERRRWQDIVDRFTAAGEGLASAHDAGLVHRDFKPENVLLGEDGRVAVADFGLARMASTHDEAATAAVDTDAVSRSLAAGTPSYMSPEQHVGRLADPRSDQFSFCVALWEALFGQRPFAPGGDSLRIAVAVVTGDITPPPSRRGVPAWLTRIVRRGLATDPAARWPSLRALLAAIRHARRRRRLAWIAAGAMTAMAASAAVTITLVGAGSADASAACVASAAPITTKWSAAHAAQIRERFGKLDASYATETGERVIQALDRWARDWQAVRIETCRARSVTHEIDEMQLTGRVACLDEYLAALDARVHLLTTDVDAKVLPRALEIARVDEPSTCKRDRRTDAVDDPAVLAERDRMRALRAEIDAEMTAGRYGKAGELAARAGKGPHDAALPIERALLDLSVAYIEVANGKYDEGIVRARSVAETLTARGEDRGAAKAWTRALDAAVLARKLDGVDITLAAARGAVQRANQVDLEVTLLVVEGRLATLQSRPVDAEAVCLKARRILQARSTRDEQREWLVDDCLVRALDGQGKFAESADVALQSLERTVRALPKDHLRLATNYHQTGATLAKVGRVREAKGLFERALALRRMHHNGNDFIAWELRHVAEAEYELGERQPALAHADESLQLALEALPEGDRELASHYQLLAKTTALTGDRVTALRHFDTAIARFEALATPDPSTLASSLHEKAKVLAASGRCAEALPLLERAKQTRMKIQNATSFHVAPFELTLAECEIELGKAASASTRVEGVVASFAGQAVLPSLSLAAAFTLARARWAKGERSADVLATARDARDRLAASGEHVHLLDKMDSFLASAKLAEPRR